MVYKIEIGRKHQIKQIITCCCLVGVFLVAVVALGIALHCKLNSDGESNTKDSPSAEQLKQDDQVKGIGEYIPTLPNLYTQLTNFFLGVQPD